MFQQLDASCVLLRKLGDLIIHHFHKPEIFFSLKLDARDTVSISGLGRYPEEENGNRLKVFFPGKSHE